MNQKILLPIITILACVTANGCLVCKTMPVWILLLFLLVLLTNVLALLAKGEFPGFRLRICNHGMLCLKAFGIATAVSVVVQIILAFTLLPLGWLDWLLSVLVCVLVLAVLFWNGMICVYLTSVQLGIRHRAAGILLGLVPIANLVMLGRIIRVTQEEIRFECEKFRIDNLRREDQICATKYPILMVHGVFFRDSRYFNYWGRIPNALTANGASVFYGEHPSALSIADSAQYLARRIRDIVRDTGCSKVNIIAHSKGGLDCRFAMDQLGIAPYVASLTTINTPHRGCKFADQLLDKIPQSVQQKVAHTYNTALEKLGDRDPDFMAAVRDLTSRHCEAFDAQTPVPEGVYCQSYGSLLNRAASGKFPMNLSYHLVKYYDGDNDGLVGTDSFAWGEYYSLLATAGERGISHGDMIDLNRENIPGFDVREFYVQLTARLKQMGF